MKGSRFYMEKDPRIRKVWDFAKREYGKADLIQHNFEHILRDLYRALIIAESEKGVNYSILIPAVLLHDIGVTKDREHKGHAEKGPPIIKKALPRMGFSSEETEEICYCVISHKGIDSEGKPLRLETKEARIVYDSDVLEKSGLPSIFGTVRFIVETRRSLHELERMVERRKRELANGFYTKRAREMDNGGLAAGIELLNAILKELKVRKDFTVKEEDVL